MVVVNVYLFRELNFSPGKLDIEDLYQNSINLIDFVQF